MIKINQKTNKSNIKKLIDIEIASLNASLSSQQALSRQILLFLKNFIGNIEIDSLFSNEIASFIEDASKNLKEINKNIDIYNKLLEILDNIKFNLTELGFKDTLIKINQYNKKSETDTGNILKSTTKIEEFIHSMSSIDISEYISVENIDTVLQTKDDNIKEEIVTETTPKSKIKKHQSSLLENTLVISEKDGCVTLPYKISELKKILKKEPEKYDSLSDIVQLLYTIPIKNYKYSAISRFKEAYKLITQREHGSKKDALNLAAELFSNYSLHPAIITACKNLNELDIYLSCLEYNELEDFHFFKIIYEALPTVTK